MADDLPEMVKRVASALSDELGDAVAPELCIALAERALKAIREPTQAMLIAAREYDDNGGRWRPMIDAALS